MRSTQPPTFARWLLEHFGCSPNNAAVVGDLDERYRQGRSRTWYSRQVLKAIFISLLREVGTHRMLALRAMLTGWALLLVAAFLFRSIVVTLVWSSLLPTAAIRHAADIHPYAAIGFLIAIGCVEWTGIGWLLKRLYRPHEKPIVLAFAGTVLVVSAVIILIIGLSAHVHPVWVGVSGNLTGLVFLLIGAGLLHSPAQRATQSG